MILLIRHAEKLIPPEQGLTPKGMSDAIQYGKQLKEKNHSFDEIITSPIERCVQTAEGIVRGLSSNTPISTSRLLGDPGIFVTDDQLAGSVFEIFSVHEIINKMIAKNYLLGFSDIDEGCIPLIHDIQNNMRLKKSILYISHDAIIMPFFASQSSVNYIQERDVIGYLGGFEIYEAHNQKRGGKRNINPLSFQPSKA